jgi:hypothetical protein
MTPHQIESLVRVAFNAVNGTSAKKQTIIVGTTAASHEFDLFEKSKIVGGISTSPWFNKSGTNNTGGQDRAATELLWLSLWPGNEKRVHVLTDKKMADRLFRRFAGAVFPRRIEIQEFDITTKKFTVIGTL